MTDMRRTHGDVDFSSWEFGSIDISDVVREPLREALEATFDTDPPHISFPYEWAIGENPEDGHGGPPVDDPLTVRVTIPLGRQECEGPTYDASLVEMIAYVLDGHRNPETCGFDDSYKPGLMKLANAFRELADRIEADVMGDEHEFFPKILDIPSKKPPESHD